MAKRIRVHDRRIIFFGTTAAIQRVWPFFDVECQKAGIAPVALPSIMPDGEFYLPGGKIKGVAWDYSRSGDAYSIRGDMDTALTESHVEALHQAIDASGTKLGTEVEVFDY